MSRFSAFTLPFAVFMLILGLSQMLGSLRLSEFWMAQPQYWSYPLQTLVCAGLLYGGWRHYQLKAPKGWTFTLLIALFVLVLWISPQEFFRVPPRVSGFNPDVFTPGSPIFFADLTLRLLRLVIVVPLLEEIFWRGFLLRYTIDEHFESVPFGSFSWFSFSAVSLCFALAHWGPDFWPALATGALYNWIAIRTRSLSSCVLAHAVTNLLLGIYILETKQWGFW